MNTPATPALLDLRFVFRVLAKALLLFAALNLIWALADPLPLLGRASFYNVLLPGRERLPYGEDPAKSYNLSLFTLEAMFASHVVSRPKAADEFRVLLIGDSATWGWRLRNQDTLAAYLNALGEKTADGRRIVAYNLGYPILSAAKDLLVLDRALQYQPDLIVWLVTLESLPADKQLFPPIVQRNPGAMRRLIAQYHLSLDPNDPSFAHPTFWDRTIVGQRRDIADVLRLQLYGVLWAATGIDQDIPPTYLPRQEDFDPDSSFHGLAGPHLRASDIALDVVRAGIERAGDTPLLLINEPIFVSHGRNSNFRYNFFYPRWAYDDYRQIMRSEADRNGWVYVDLWDSIPMTEYTDSAIHLTPYGESLLAQQVGAAIAALAR